MWAFLPLIATAVTPAGSVSGNLTDYILNYGVLGVFAVVAGTVLYKGLLVPAKRAKADQDAAVALARADLVTENQRLIAENARLITERDAALKIAQEQVVPLLTSFVGTTSALLPLLQDLVAMREDLRRNTRRPGDG